MKKKQEFYKIGDMKSSIPVLVSSLYCVEKYTVEHKSGIRDMYQVLDNESLLRLTLK